MRRVLSDKSSQSRWKVFGRVIRVVAPIVLFSIVLSQIEVSQIRIALQTAKWEWVLVGFVLFAFMDVWRALRYRLWLKARLSLLFPVSIVQGVLNTLLPLRAGEFSFPYLLARRDVSVEHSVLGLVWVRLLDLIVLSLGVLATGLSWFAGSRSTLVLSALAVFGGTLVVVWATRLFARRILAGRDLENPDTHMHLPSFLTKWFSIARAWVVSFHRMGSSLSLTISIALTALLWLENSLVSLFLLRSVGLELSFSQVAFAVSVLQFVSLLPINILGGLGIVDVSWIGLLVFYQVPVQTASHVIVATRVLFWGYVLVWGLVGWLLWSVTLRRTR